MNKKKNQTFLKKISKVFRVVILDVDTFEEKNSMLTSKLQLYIIGMGSALLLILLTTLLFFFTPLKQFVPGYGSIRDTKALYNLNKQIVEMENEVKAMETYSSAFRRVLVGDVETEDDIQKEDIEFKDSELDVDRIEEDEILRKEIEQKQKEDLSFINNGGSMANFSPENHNFGKPLEGQISAKFDLKNNHFGIDIIASKDSPILAISPGVVISADNTIDNGNTITILHDNHLVSSYKHNSRLLKKLGQRVKKSEAIAIIGNTGILTNGPHLHFELWFQGNALDPELFFTFE